ncbi:hypothetical protein [Enhygromyxa salina]|uniref:Alpha/beta hydrolase family protein n=1 Tax=Enhygromyxa salina TaxID=215803 RepID=A0A2S9XQT1_9BACT|nr:hypothetical protein [Enhygromyxa salina]PRP95215.1 hypothetical protein ENSA7_75290 [Enhygromyxa salina]
MPRITRALARFALMLMLGLGGCAGRNAKPPGYRPVSELERCRPGECVAAELGFRRWADAEHYRGRMPYHCDPGSELDGPPNSQVTRMIFVVHGVVGPSAAQLERLREPPGLFQLRGVINALARAQRLDPSLDPDTFAIVAPTFQRTTHWQPYTDEDKRAWTWSGSTYNTGTQAAPRETYAGIVKADAVSSFDVIDEFLRAGLVKFPNLETVVVVGHSAGGQTVHRYALLGVGVHEHLEHEGIHVRYIPANPGLYAFPMMTRKLPPGQASVRPGVGRGDTHDWRWTAPRGCDGYDDWGYGLGGLGRVAADRSTRAADYAITQYLRPVDRKLARQAERNPGSAIWAKAARAALRMQYASREVWHIQAANDHEDTFGTNCRATVQGRSRFERFSNFQQAWTQLVGIPAPELHFIALEGATHPHSSRVVYASDAGVHLLFY